MRRHKRFKLSSGAHGAMQQQGVKIRTPSSMQCLAACLIIASLLQKHLIGRRNVAVQTNPVADCFGGIAYVHFFSRLTPKKPEFAIGSKSLSRRRTYEAYSTLSFDCHPFIE